MPSCKRLHLEKDSSPEVDDDEEDMMEVEGGTKHRKLTRAEKSKNAAKCRRDKEAVEFGNMINMLPFPNEELEKMDKSSVVKLTTSYLKMLNLVEKEMGSLTISDDNNKAICKPPPSKTVKLPDGTPILESQMMLDALDGFLIILDRKRKILYISKNVEDHLGLSQVHLIGKPIEDFLEEKDIPELRKQFNLKFLSNGNRNNSMETDDDHHQLDEHRMFYIRMLCQYKNNKTKYKGHTLVQWTGKLKMRRTHKANNFATTGLMCVCKVMQTNSILEIKMDGNMFMSRHDLGMTFTFCDPRIITLIGYEPSEVIGRTAYQFHNPLDAERVRNCHSNLIVKGSSVSKYYRFVGKNCDWVWMQTRATIIYNTNNVPQYIVCMNYIISEEEGVRVLMEEDKDSLNCTGVMEISGKPLCVKSREHGKGDNHDHHSDNGYHSSYSPYSSINPSPLSESSFSHKQFESDDCGASIGDANDDFPMSVVQECASSLDTEAANDEEVIKFIESLDGNDNTMTSNLQQFLGNVQWNTVNSSHRSSTRKNPLQRIQSCPQVSSLLPIDDNEFDDQPIEFSCRPNGSNVMPNSSQINSRSEVNYEIPKQGLMNIQIGSLNDGNLLASSTLSESLPKEISDFCMQYAESMADMQSNNIISQYAHDSLFPDLDGINNHTQNNRLSVGFGSPNSPHSFVGQQPFVDTQQSLYPTSPQMYYGRNSDTPNSYISATSALSPQQSFSNINSPMSVETNIPSPASDFSNARSPHPQAKQCSVGINNYNSVRSPLPPNYVNQVTVSQNQTSYAGQRLNGNFDRIMKINSGSNMSQIGNCNLMNQKVRNNGQLLCNGTNQPMVNRMAPPSNQQLCTQSRSTHGSMAQNNGNPSKGLRNVKSMSELEKMLRGYSPPFLQGNKGKQMENSSETEGTLLQQMLTGKLSGEKYIAMEKQRQLNCAIRTSHQ